MTSISRTQFVDAFKLADADGDKKLTRSEVEKARSNAEPEDPNATALGYLEKYGKLISKIDNKSGLTMDEVDKAIGLDGKKDSGSVEDMELLAKKAKEERLDLNDQLQRQELARLQYQQRNQPYQWVSPHSAYQTSLGSNLPPSLQGLLSNVGAASTEATQFMGQMGTAQQQAGGSDMNYMQYYTGIDMTGYDWSNMLNVSG